MQQDHLEVKGQRGELDTKLRHGPNRSGRNGKVGSHQEPRRCPQGMLPMLPTRAPMEAVPKPSPYHCRGPAGESRHSGFLRPGPGRHQCLQTTDGTSAGLSDPTDSPANNPGEPWRQAHRELSCQAHEYPGPCQAGKWARDAWPNLR